MSPPLAPSVCQGAGEQPPGIAQHLMAAVSGHQEPRANPSPRQGMKLHAASFSRQHWEGKGLARAPPSPPPLLPCSAPRPGCCGLECGRLGDRWPRHGLAKPCVFGRRRVCLGRSGDVISSASHRDELGKPTGGCTSAGARAGPLGVVEGSDPDGSDAPGPVRREDKQRDLVGAARVMWG